PPSTTLFPYTTLFRSLFLSGAVFAQKGELNKGKASYSKFSEVKQIGNAQLGVKDLAAARESLEKASTHDKTKDLSETWTYLALRSEEHTSELQSRENL